jgi:hypothetical protein
VNFLLTRYLRLAQRFFAPLRMTDEDLGLAQRFFASLRIADIIHDL